MVEIGRVDIITKVLALSSHLSLPREGHLEAVYHVYAYLKSKHNSWMVFDPNYPEIDMSGFKQCDWKNFYGDVEEAFPPNVPAPRVKEVDIKLYVDSSHADDVLTCRSQSGYFIFLNSAPIALLSKNQYTIETLCWCRIHGHEGWNGGPMWVEVQANDDGISHLRAILHLW